MRQQQCLVRSTGTVLNTQRVIERALQKHSGFFDGASVSLTNAAVNLGGTPGTLPPGINHVIAVVSLHNTGNTITITANNMLLLKNNNAAAPLASNQYDIMLGGAPAPTSDVFNQKTLFFVYRDPNGVANDAYNVRITSNTLTTGSGEVKMLTFNGFAASGYDAGGPVNVAAGSTGILRSYTTALPAGNNVVLAAVQITNNNAGNQDAFVAAGDLQLHRGTSAGPVVDSNARRIDLRSIGGGGVNRGIGVLLMARDTNAVINQPYTVTMRPTTNSLSGQASILVVSGVTSRFASGTATLGISLAPIASLSTDLLDGTNLVIDTAQFENASAGQVTISAGNERITYAASTVALSSNEFPRNLCPNASENCNDFFSGLLWSSSTAAAASYRVQAAASAAVNAAANIMAIQAPRGIVDWQEIFP